MFASLRADREVRPYGAVLALVVAAALVVGSARGASYPQHVSLGNGKTRLTIKFPAGANLGRICAQGRPYVAMLDQAAATGTVDVAGPDIFVLRPDPVQSVQPRYWDRVPNNIEGLDLGGLDYGNDLIKKLIPRFKNLRYLGMEDSDIDDQVFELLPQLPKLEYLNVNGTQINGSGLVHLAKLPELYALLAAGSTIRPENFKYLPQIQKMQLLRLHETALNDNACKYVGQCRKLTSLSIGKNIVSSKGIAYLVPLKDTLISLDVTACDIDDDALKSIGKLQRLEGLTARMLKKTTITGKGVAYLKPLTKLTQLAFNSSFIHDDVLESVGKNCPNVNFLAVESCPHLTDKGFAKLAPLKNLGSLDAVETGAGDGLLQAATNWKNLVKLSLGSTQITDPGLLKLGASASPYLSDLELDNNDAITDKGLANLHKLPQLRQLVLTATGITDGAVPHLVKCKNLTGLGVMHTRMTASGIAKIRAALPKCAIAGS